jgi:hypothetical protein
MCRPPRIPANLEERTARRSLPATFVGFVKVPKLTGARHVIYNNSYTTMDREKTLNDAHRTGIIIVP